MDPVRLAGRRGRRRRADGAGDVPARPPDDRLDRCSAASPGCCSASTACTSCCPGSRCSTSSWRSSCLRGALPGRRPRLGPRPARPPWSRPAARGLGAGGPLLFRPWLLAAGVVFGLAIGTKWTALFPLAAFGLLVWLLDAGARRSFGVRWPLLQVRVVDGAPRVRPPRAGRPRRLRRHLDRLADARRRVRGGTSRTRSTRHVLAEASSGTTRHRARRRGLGEVASRCARCGTTTRTSTPSTPTSSTTATHTYAVEARRAGCC